MLRLLMVRPWLVAGRDDDAIAKVKRNAEALRYVLGRLGWVLVVERDLVRLRKTPPARREAHVAAGPNQRTWEWFFLLVAAAESMGRRVALGALVAAARAAAAEAEVPSTGDIGERRAIVAALKMLSARGVIEELDGEVGGYVHDDNPPVLLAVHHTRLLHVVANYSGEHDPVEDPEGWLEAVEREPDAGRRMRRRLVDDTLVHSCDLDDSEADWLSRRLRGDDGAPLAEAFGLHIERRSEGAAFVVPEDSYRHDWELGPLAFPGSGTVAHAALLVCNWVAAEPVPGPAVGPVPEPGPEPGPEDAAETEQVLPAGWRGVDAGAVAAKLAELAADEQAGSAGWSRELAADPEGRLLDEVEALLVGLDLVRRDGAGRWLFSPASARWPSPQRRAPRPKPKASDSRQRPLDLGAHDGPALV